MAPQAGDLRRSLVFGLLLLAGGGLVALNGGCGSRIPLAGLAIGAGLWLLLLASPVLQRLLSLAVLQPPQIAAVLVTAALAVLLAGLLGPPGQPSSGTPAGSRRPGPGCPPG